MFYKCCLSEVPLPLSWKHLSWETQVPCVTHVLQVFSLAIMSVRAASLRGHSCWGKTMLCWVGKDSDKIWPSLPPVAHGRPPRGAGDTKQEPGETNILRSSSDHFSGRDFCPWETPAGTTAGRCCCVSPFARGRTQLMAWTVSLWDGEQHLQVCPEQSKKAKTTNPHPNCPRKDKNWLFQSLYLCLVSVCIMS